MSQKEPIFTYLKSISEFIPVPFWWMSLDKVVLGCNQVCLKSIGASKEDEYVGKNAHEIYNDDYIANQFNTWIGEVIATQISSQKEHIITDLKTGKIKHFSGTFAPLKNEIGKVIGVIGTSIDITVEKELANLKYERDIEAVRSEAHKNKILQEFGVIAAKVAHDISSPLMVANSSLRKMQNNKLYLDEQALLVEQSLNDIKNISGKILSTYREITGKDSKVKLHKVDDGNTKRYVLLSSLLENQIGFKKIEWQANPCKLELIVNDNARNIFAYISPTEFNRSFSNLLNNAYESLGSDNRNIYVKLEVEDYKFILSIRDTGRGIPQDKITCVLSGESSKHEGHGMGLSGAKAYFESIAGKLELTSKINNGTEIIIHLPIATDPSWFDRAINYNPNTRFAILDDSSTIIMLWQRVLSDLNLKCNYFMNVDDFMTWYDNQNYKENIVLFADYDLGNENFTGLDVVSKVKDIKSYLVTNHSEESWIQDIVKSQGLKLLPKKIIEHLIFNLY